MDQAHGQARFGVDKAIEYLLQLASDGAAISRASGLIDDQAHVMALLLGGQYLDGGIGVGQRSGLWRCHDQHFIGQ